jgi:hypothetical protein
MPQKPAEMQPAKKANQVVGRVIHGDKVTISYADGRMETRAKTASDEQPLANFPVPEMGQAPAKAAPAQPGAQAPAQKQQWYQYEGEGATDPNKPPKEDPNAKWSPRLNSWVTTTPTEEPIEPGNKGAITPETVEPSYKEPRGRKDTSDMEREAEWKRITAGGPIPLLKKIADRLNMTPDEIQTWVDENTEQGRREKKERAKKEYKEDIWQGKPKKENEKSDDEEDFGKTY